MCGRYSLGLARRQIRAMPGHDLEIDQWIEEESFAPRHNIAPRSQAPIIMRQAGPSESAADSLVLRTAKWGLVPHWSKHEDKSLNTINARSENLLESGGMWQSIKGKKRCVVICEGYYEWLKKGKDRLPHFIRPKDSQKMMLLAGLYDCTVLEGSTEPLWTFTIVTTAACDDLLWLHDRQPVVLTSKAALETWLDTSSQKWTPALTKLVQPSDNVTFPLECYQVPKEVGKVGAESSTFIEPIANRKDGIQAMFSRQKEAQVSPKKGSPRKRKRSITPDKAADSSKTTTSQVEPKAEVDGSTICLDEQPSPSSAKAELTLTPTRGSKKLKT
ncbi:DUF159-domain-containing protein, partial [Athelia psychrophila]